jgi:hypothetical protein
MATIRLLTQPNGGMVTKHACPYCRKKTIGIFSIGGLDALGKPQGQYRIQCANADCVTNQVFFSAGDAESAVEFVLERRKTHAEVLKERMKEK